ncbi:MAG TPA: AtpZ/AtpI family protein [Allosphingosinicella sp.]|jgi:ATP synthase protein I
MAEDEPGQDPKLPEDARLASLDERLRQAQHAEAARTGQARKSADRSEQLGNRVLSYLIGGLAGGALIGWVLDRWLGTSPLLLISLLILGTVGGFWNIIKISTQRPD